MARWNLSMLPSSISCCAEIGWLTLIQHRRGQGHQMPALVLSAKRTVDDRVKGACRQACDDYLVTAVRVRRIGGPGPGLAAPVERCYGTEQPSLAVPRSWFALPSIHSQSRQRNPLSCQSALPSSLFGPDLSGGPPPPKGFSQRYRGYGQKVILSSAGGEVRNP